MPGTHAAGKMHVYIYIYMYIYNIHIDVYGTDPGAYLPCALGGAKFGKA